MASIFLTGGPIAYVPTVDSKNADVLIAAIHGAVSFAGWGLLSDIDHGHIYQIVSPQNMSAKVKIWDPRDPAWPNHIAFQLYSTGTADRDAGDGGVHHLEINNNYDIADNPPWYYAGAFKHYTLWANQCSLFIGQKGIPNAPGGTGDAWAREASGANRAFLSSSRAVQLGIPHIYSGSSSGGAAGNCHAAPTAPQTSECWWISSGDSGTPGTGASNFRNDYWCGAFTLNWNGGAEDVRLPAGELREQLLQLALLRPAHWPSLNEFQNGIIKIADAKPYTMTPHMLAGGVIFGALYDAVLASAPLLVDQRVDIKFGGATGEYRNYAAHFSFTADGDGNAYSLLLRQASSFEGLVDNFTF